MSKKSYEQFTGWYGVVAILLAYALVSFAIFLPAHPLILFLNISGAIGLVLENLRQKDWPVVTLNTIWLLIAVATLRPLMDISLFRIINNFAGRYSWLDMLGIFAAEYLIILLVLDVLVHADIAMYRILRKKMYDRVDAIVIALRSCIAVVGAMATNAVIGLIWYRPRPFLALENVNKLIEKGAEKSFPSDHATFAFALAFSILLVNKRWGIAMIVLAAVVALGRVFVGVHYPSDIIAGMSMGLIWAVLVRATGEHWHDREKVWHYFKKRFG